MPLATIEAAIEDYRAGKFVVILDDEERENEGDLAMPAEAVTPAAINFLATHARGLICVAMLPARLDQLRIPLMVPNNARSLSETAFCVSVDARDGVISGTSAYDRAATVRALVDPYARPEMFRKPGHVFPLRYREGGVLVRRGHTEASVDLAIAAGLTPAAVICEVMNTDGTMARLPQLEAFAWEHDLNIITVAQLLRYRIRQAPKVCAS